MKYLTMTLILCFFYASFAYSDNHKLLFDFQEAGAAGNWRSVNDNVMGGVSKGGFKIDDGKLVFSGDLSLENRGGFASIRTNRSSLNLSQYDAIVIRLRGDGRQYSMNIGTNAWIPAGAYWSKFDTSGRWQEIRLPFESFKATAFGRPYALAGKMNPANIRTLGFTISDKKAGEFFLEVDWIKAVKESEDNKNASSPTASDNPKDIVDIAVGAGSFNTLVAAVKAAGLVETLKSPGPFTVFAPTDDAFAKLPAGTLKSLLQPENKDKLTAILKFHVVPGRFYLAKKQFKTVLGDSLTVDSSKSMVVNGANITKADIEASNGVIHVIDKVLLPQLPEPTAKNLIEAAINKGVPLFNSGNVEKCASIYESTVIDLMGMPDDKIGVENRKTLNAALKKGLNESARSKAWTLRRAMDRVYHNLK